MGYGPIINGKQHPITPWHGSWAQTEFAKKCEPPQFSRMHGRWIVRHPERPELIVASGHTADSLRWALPGECAFSGSLRY